MRNFVNRKMAKNSTVCKDVRRHKAKQPTCLTSSIYIKLPVEYADALYAMYPGVTLTKALRTHIALTVTPKESENNDA